MQPRTGERRCHASIERGLGSRIKVLGPFLFPSIEHGFMPKENSGAWGRAPLLKNSQADLSAVALCPAEAKEEGLSAFHVLRR